MTGTRLPSADRHQRQVNAHFDAEAHYWKDLYEMRNLFGLIHQERRSLALSWVDELALPTGSRILEIGCGAGLMAVDLHRRGYVIDCIDISEVMVNLARAQAAQAGIK